MGNCARVGRKGIGATGFCLNMVLGLVYAWSLFSGPLEAAFRGTAVDTSRVFSVSMMGLCLGHLASGWLSSRLPSRGVMLMASGFAAAGFALSAAATGFGWLTVSYGVLCGFATGLGANCVMNTVLPWFADRKGLASGVLLAGVGLGPLVLGPAVGALISHAGWRVAFAVLAGAVGGLLVLGALVLRRPVDEGAEKQVSGPADAAGATGSFTTAQMLRTRAFWLFFCWIVLVSSGGLALISNAVPAALDVLGSREAAAVAAATGAMGTLSGFNSVGRVVVGFLWDRLGPRGAMATVSAAFAIAMLLCAAAQAMASFPLMVVGFLLLGASYGGAVSVGSALISQFFGMGHYALNYAVATLNVLVASCVGPTVSGFSSAMTGGYLAAYLALLAFAVASLLVAAGIRKPG